MTSNDQPSVTPSQRMGLLIAVAAFAALAAGAGAWWWMKPAGDDSQQRAHATPEADRLRRAQALAVNEPGDASALAWERAARAYRAQRSASNDASKP